MSASGAAIFLAGPYTCRGLLPYATTLGRSRLTCNALPCYSRAGFMHMRCVLGPCHMCMRDWTFCSYCPPKTPKRSSGFRSVALPRAAAECTVSNWSWRSHYFSPGPCVVPAFAARGECRRG